MSDADLIAELRAEIAEQAAEIERLTEELLDADRELLSKSEPREDYL